MESTTSQDKSLFELQIDEEGIGHLSEMARWAKFLSIVGFILCGLFVMGAVLAASMTSGWYSYPNSGNLIRQTVGYSSLLVSLLYIVISLLYFFPLLYLYNFSTKMQAALRNNDQQNLNTSLDNLRSCFKFVGILTIIILSFFVLITIIVVSASAFLRW